MSNIKRAFENGKAFIPFITCGDPDLDTTAKIIRAMEKNGADLIELGIPFSDPTAEGPVIQEANIRALSAGTTTDKVFDMVRQLRSGSDAVKVPMVFMTYANVVFSYGAEKFISTCANIGIDGLILPNIPYEEKGEFVDITRRYGLDLVSLIAPTSEGRITKIASEAEGFIYVVSSLGVTGVRSRITTDIGSVCSAIKASSSVPCAIGFGISTPEQARDMAQYADGVIVGSAIVKLIAANGRDSAPVVGEYVKKMKVAIS
ncbi:MAG: tryptophan synthase subunit alpha [Clostridiales bacterium]|nr:tryptophan synthase subunit alpha [Clostridiales bacterium]